MFRSRCRLLLVVSILAANVPAPADEWLQFGGPSRDFQVDTAHPKVSTKLPSVQWQLELGKGLSGVAVDYQHVYTTFLKPWSEAEASQDESSRPHREVVISIDRTTGRSRWQYEYDAGWIGKQQVFGGRSRTPQASPAIIGDRVVTVGFTGIVHGLNRQTGTLEWKIDLVKQYDAIPVQFGFSSSPLVDGERLFILAGGSKGGLLSIDPVTGRVRWSVACEEASYATPIVFEVGGSRQVVFVSRDQMIGVDQEDGDVLWRYPLPKQGMTNVPTPLSTGDGSLVVSGQGIGGTQKLTVKNTGSGWKVSEDWFIQRQFFYCNWIVHNDAIFGCDGDLLLSLDLKTGNSNGRWRGFAESNLVAGGSQLFVLDGEGVLTTLDCRPDRLDVVTRHRVMEERCWVPPAIVDGQLYCRGGERLMCVSLSGNAKSRSLEPLKINRPKLVFSRNSGKHEKLEALDQIVDAFEQGGPGSALEVYEQIREADPDTLTIEDRAELADLALAQGLKDAAKLFVKHLTEDFPDQADARKLQQSLTSRIDAAP